MCAKIGVDPLASNKGVWAQLGVSQFYTELSVQIVDVCLSTRALNGGLLEVDDLISYVKVMKGSNAVDISEDDVSDVVRGQVGAPIKPRSSRFSVHYEFPRR